MSGGRPAVDHPERDEQTCVEQGDGPLHRHARAGNKHAARPQGAESREPCRLGEGGGLTALDEADQPSNLVPDVREGDKDEDLYHSVLVTGWRTEGKWLLV